jgi:3-phenylpropionate/cinnamic acid dioxygenase small subunit
MMEPQANGSSGPDIEARQLQMMRWWEVQDFLSTEAELLDTRQYEAWLALLHPQVTYRIPIARNTRRDRMQGEYTAEGEIAWLDEGIETLRKRVAQIKTGMHWAEEPASRISRVIGNIRVVKEESPGDLTVHSRFVIYQSRLEAEVSLFAGHRRDVLTRSDSGWLILRRDVFLSQSVLLTKALTVFF